MGLSLYLPPAIEPVSVAHLKMHMRVEHDAEDGLIAALQMAAREEFERTANRSIVAQTWQLTFDYWGHGSPLSFDWGSLSYWGSVLALPRPPLLKVLSITYRDINNALQTLAADQYTVDASSPDTQACISPAYGVTWPSLYRDRNVVTVRYVSGFAVPVSVNASSDVFTSIGRDYADDEPVTLSVVAEEQTLPAPLSAFRIYYVRDTTGPTFKVSETVGGVAIDVTEDSSKQLFIGRIPEGIRSYFKLMVAHRYENREPINIGNIVHEIPLAAESLFWAYRAAEA